MAEEKGIGVPFDVAQGTPIRITFRNLSGKRVTATLGMTIHEVVDNGPDANPAQRYTINFGSHMRVTER